MLLIVLAGFLVGVPRGSDGGDRRRAPADHAHRRAAEVYDEVDWGLLVFFLGLFIIVGGAERAGLTATLLHPVATWDLHRIPIFVVGDGRCSATSSATCRP